MSDALRWEIGKGRVARVGRGTYEARTFPRQTLLRMRKRVAALCALRRWLDAAAVDADGRLLPFPGPWPDERAMRDARRVGGRVGPP